jgi:hypothetical protein
MIVVDLDAEDDGSGKLIRFYTNLGFHMKGKQNISQDVYMEAPIRSVSCLAPQHWIEAMVPRTFEPWAWLQPEMKDHQVERVLLSTEVPWKFSWKAGWPLAAQVSARLRVGKTDGFRKITLECSLRESGSEDAADLATARGSVVLKLRKLRVLWVGRSSSRSVDSSVKGKRIYEAAVPSLESESGHPQTRVTAAIALLGVLGVLGRWFDAETVDMLALNDTDRRLSKYFQRFGFEVAVKDSDPAQLEASCLKLARWCPCDWSPHLPPDSQLGILSKLVP